MITKWPTRVVKISTLVDHPENPRVPISEDEDFHASLKGSLDAFGYAQHIVWNERTGYVVSGHQRLQLLREAGETDVEVIAVDYDNDTERAALLAFNRIHGRFKDKELADLLAKLDKDMKARTGFSGDEIKRLLRAMAMRSRDPNDVPETPTPVTRPGDLIILGDHRLLCGDSTKREDVARLMDGEMTTMVFTDPPYNCNYGASMAPSKQSRTRKSSTLGSGRGGGGQEQRDRQRQHAHRGVARVLPQAVRDLQGVLQRRHLSMGSIRPGRHALPNMAGGGGMSLVSHDNLGQGLHGNVPGQLSSAVRAVLLRMVRQIVVRPADEARERPHRTVGGMDRPEAEQERVAPYDEAGGDLREGNLQLLEAGGHRPRSLRRLGQHAHRLRTSRSSMPHDGARPALLRRYSRPMGAAHRAAGSTAGWC